MSKNAAGEEHREGYCGYCAPSDELANRLSVRMPGPLAARVGTETSGNAKFNSGGEEFTCAAVLQVPLLEHLSSPPRQKSQGWMLHAIDSDGLGEPSQS
eukprot:1211389-Pyramimonas_sp.AAC.1